MENMLKTVQSYWTASTKYRPYIVPFLIFGLLTYAGSEKLSPHAPYFMYPIKTLVVGALLYFYRKAYSELRLNFSWLAVLVGIIVFVIWVAPEGMYPLLTDPSGFTPYVYTSPWIVWSLVFFRFAGAVIVVPIMEELFWRSFALRWLIDEEFTRVAIGKFTWFSFVVVVLGFGFEHHRWLVGLIAGVLYNALLYYKKDLFNCVLAHAITNLLLGIYVMLTHQWTFW